jgi:transposase
MSMSYLQDLRELLLAAHDRGMKTKQIAAVFAVSPAWARRIKHYRRQTGDLTPRSVGCLRVPRVAAVAILASLLHPDPIARAPSRRRSGDIAFYVGRPCTGAI